ncbi:MAG: cobalt ECF transporter T component CbiQ [Anaerolineae bacterium]|nr:cobalt ECF transporter T component CbiQ [Anaerolineae bacterium]
MPSLDPFQPRDSLIHHLDPRVKVVVTVLFIVSNVLLPDGAWLAFALAWGMAAATALLAHIPLSFILKRAFIVIPFTAAAFTLLFTLPGEPVTSFRLFTWQLTISDTGLIRFLSILARSWVSVQMAILLAAATPFYDLMHALRHLRVPSILVSIISFMYRYLFVMVDEVQRLIRARTARSAVVPGQRSGGTVMWRAKVTGHLAGQLMVRSFERSDRVYNAMLARGFGGELLTLNPHLMRRQDWYAAALAILLLLGLQLCGRVF